MPELPWSIFTVQRSSKSPTVPPRQIRNVLPLVGFSLVVSPFTTLSLIDQSAGLPSHPVRSLPLKSGFIPSGSAGALCETSSANATDAMSNAAATTAMNRMNASQLKCFYVGCASAHRSSVGVLQHTLRKLLLADFNPHILL